MSDHSLQRSDSNCLVKILIQSATVWQRDIVLPDGFLSRFKVCVCVCVLNGIVSMFRWKWNLHTAPSNGRLVAQYGKNYLSVNLLEHCRNLVLLQICEQILQYLSIALGYFEDNIQAAYTTNCACCITSTVVDYIWSLSIAG